MSDFVTLMFFDFIEEHLKNGKSDFDKLTPEECSPIDK